MTRTEIYQGVWGEELNADTTRKGVVVASTCRLSSQGLNCLHPLSYGSWLAAEGHVPPLR